jgi:hypothetical protein
MIKTSIGELKLSPLKDNGKFLFFNDFVTINGKVSKGDRITIYVDSYDVSGDKHVIKGSPATASLIVRGITHTHADINNCTTVEDYYKHISEQYKSHFYFGNKQ